MTITTEQLKLRRADSSDCRFVWETNNHPSVREQSINRASIPWEDHEKWYSNSLQRQDRILLIAEDATGRVGTLRFDVSDNEDTATISIALSVSSRGKGYGQTLIREGSRDVLARARVERIEALIRPENAASRKAFSRAGYIRAGRKEQNGVDLLRYEFTAD